MPGHTDPGRGQDLCGDRRGERGEPRHRGPVREEPVLAQQDGVLLHVGVGGGGEDLAGGERGDGVLRNELDAGQLSRGAEGRPAAGLH